MLRFSPKILFKNTNLKRISRKIVWNFKFFEVSVKFLFKKEKKLVSKNNLSLQESQIDMESPHMDPAVVMVHHTVPPPTTQGPPFNQIFIPPTTLAALQQQQQQHFGGHFQQQQQQQQKQGAPGKNTVLL